MSRIEEWRNLSSGPQEKELELRKVIDCPICGGFIELIKEVEPNVYDCICKGCEVTLLINTQVQIIIDTVYIKPIKKDEDESIDNMFSNVTIENNSRPKSIFTDGSTDGNPGPGTCAFITNLGAKGHRATKHLGRVTNSVAEFEGVIMGLEFAQLVSGDITLYSDSEFIVKALNGEYTIRKEHLMPLYNKCIDLTGKRDAKGYKTLIIHCTHDENLAHKYAYSALQSHKQQTQYVGKGDSE